MISSGKIDEASGIVFVDDGSRDNTWEIIDDLAGRHRCVSGIKLSRNRGHQNAMLAGLFTAGGDALVSIDADLQDDVEAIEPMVDAHRDGAEIVYGVRRRRDTDSLSKRLTAQAFYRGISFLGAESVYNHADSACSAARPSRRSSSSGRSTCSCADWCP